MAPDPFDLKRFVPPQDAVMDTVEAELAAGRKRSHWMWFVFPQLAALGLSATAQRYGLGSLAEARAYLAHPVLGPRLRHCCELLQSLPTSDADAIFGYPDEGKLRSSLTLFGLAAPDDDLFARCLEKFYGGEPDRRTLELCGGG